MATPSPSSRLTPLQRAIYEVDQLGLNLRDSMRLVTQRMGFFVGQQRYLEERAKIAAVLAQHGATAMRTADAATGPREPTHQAGSTS